MYEKHAETGQAAKSLSRLRRLDSNDPSIVEELVEVEANHRYEMSIGKAYVNLLKKSLIQMT